MRDQRFSLAVVFKKRWFLSLLLALFVAASPTYSATLVSSSDSGAAESASGSAQKTVSITLEDTLVDHRAKILSIQGEVEILKNQSSDWDQANTGDYVDEGDQVRTGENSYAEISYDEFHLNYVRIDEKTVVEFETLEPTLVHIEDGSLFSQLDGLVEGAKYEVSTPTSVAAVRGTSFSRAFDAEAFTDDTSVVEGIVNVLPLDDQGYALESHSFEVTRDQSLAFDRKALINKHFDQIGPKPTLQKNRDRLRRLHQKSIHNRQQHAGGAAQENRLKQQFQKIKRNPDALKRMQTNRERHLETSGKKTQDNHALKKAKRHGSNSHAFKKHSDGPGSKPKSKDKKLFAKKSMFKDKKKGKMMFQGDKVMKKKSSQNNAQGPQGSRKLSSKHSGKKNKLTDHRTSRLSDRK